MVNEPMPYLQFDTDFDVPESDAAAFSETVAELYADLMDAKTSYTAVGIRDGCSLHLGRAEEGPIVILQADIRAGRDVDRKRELALDVMDLVAEQFEVPLSNQKVVFTEHDGDHMMGYERVGEDWPGDE